jgi:hypothetical protein
MNVVIHRNCPIDHSNDFGKSRSVQVGDSGEALASNMAENFERRPV